MVAYTGIETVSNMAEEAKDPGHDVPKAVNLVVIAVLGVYAGISVVALSALPIIHHAAGFSPALSETYKHAGYATALGGHFENDPVLGIVTRLGLHGTVLTLAKDYVGVLAATILFIATNAGLIGISRLSWSLSEHRQLPSIFSQLHPSFRTPWFTIVAKEMVGQHEARHGFEHRNIDLLPLASPFTVIESHADAACRTQPDSAISDIHWHVSGLTSRRVRNQRRNCRSALDQIIIGGSARVGSVFPVAEQSAKMIDGLDSWTASYDNPKRANAAGRTLVTSTSLLTISLRRIECPAGFLISIEIDRLLRLSPRKKRPHFGTADRADRSCVIAGKRLDFMTSAPCSASTSHAYGPIRTVEKSRTLTLLSGPGIYGIFLTGLCAQSGLK